MGGKRVADCDMGSWSYDRETKELINIVGFVCSGERAVDELDGEIEYIEYVLNDLRNLRYIIKGDM